MSAPLHQSNSRRVWPPALQDYFSLDRQTFGKRRCALANCFGCDWPQVYYGTRVHRWAPLGRGDAIELRNRYLPTDRVCSSVCGSWKTRLTILRAKRIVDAGCKCWIGQRVFANRHQTPKIHCGSNRTAGNFVQHNVTSALIPNVVVSKRSLASQRSIRVQVSKSMPGIRFRGIGVIAPDRNANGLDDLGGQLPVGID